MNSHINNDINTKAEQVIERIDDLLKIMPSIIVAIDGSCTSGKTTLADHICRQLDEADKSQVLAEAVRPCSDADVDSHIYMNGDDEADSGIDANAAALAGYHLQYDCHVIHLDDFFLRPEQRTEERLKEVGGNVDYERFLSEVLLPLRDIISNPVNSSPSEIDKKESSIGSALSHTDTDVSRSFSFRPFDCQTLSLQSAFEVKPGRVTIIEGSYSMHPTLRDFYDLRVFLNVTDDAQHERIMKRPERLHARFFNEWIPKEQAYILEMNVPASCDLIL